MRVYHREHAGRPIRVTWALEEAGQDYELVRMNQEEGRSDEHLARHPLARVPVLELDDGSFVFESGAICLQVADLYPQAGLNAELGTPERARVYQWTLFGPAEIEPPLIESAMAAERDPERSANARGRFDRAAAAVSAALGEGEFLVGGRLTVADIMVGSAIRFTSRIGIADELPENLKDYIAALAARPAFQRALERTNG